MPPAISRLPVSDPKVAVATLLDRVRASELVAYSGYAETLGTFALPSTRGLSDLTSLFGGHTRLRVWRRTVTDWRVDSLSPVGEQGIYRDGSGIWLWDFAANRAVRTTQPAVRLPAAPDLLPAELGRRLLSEAHPAELQRLPARTIAGRTAEGVRLRPAERNATIDRVDVWVDPRTGLSMRVEVWGKAAPQPAVQASFLDLHVGRPAARLTRFAAPVGAQLSTEDPRDVSRLAEEFGFTDLPARLAGLPLRHDAPGLGSYGRGPTFLTAVPLSRRGRFRLLDRIQAAPGAHVDPADGSSSLAAGPLSLLVAAVAGESWLFTGTVTVVTLQRAAAQLNAART